MENIDPEVFNEVEEMMKEVENFSRFKLRFYSCLYSFFIMTNTVMFCFLFTLIPTSFVAMLITEFSLFNIKLCVVSHFILWHLVISKTKMVEDDQELKCILWFLKKYIHEKKIKKKN